MQFLAHTNAFVSAARRLSAASLLLHEATIFAADVEKYATLVAPLIDHRILTTLGPRAANTATEERVQTVQNAP